MTLLNDVSDHPSGNRCALKGYRPLLSTVQPLRAAAALRYCSNLGFTLVCTKCVQYVSFPTSRKLDGKPLQRYIHSSEVLILNKIRHCTDTYWYPLDMGLKCNDVSDGSQCRTCVLCVSRLPKYGTSLPKQLRAETMKYILWFVFYCILSSEFVG